MSLRRSFAQDYAQKKLEEEPPNATKTPSEDTESLDEVQEVLGTEALEVMEEAVEKIEAPEEDVAEDEILKDIKVGASTEVEPTPRKTRSERVVAFESGEVAYIKHLPKSLVEHCQSLFPQLTQREAVVCFIGAHMDEVPLDLDPESYQQIRDYQNELKRDERRFEGIYEHLKSLEHKLNTMSRQVDTIELGVSYTIFDRMGFRKEMPARAIDINYAEKPMDSIHQGLKEQAMRNREKDERRRFSKSGH